MNNRECVNCGAENELLVSSCAFCGSTIVNEKFVEQESDELEDLIQNCGLWIARFESVVSSVGTLNSVKQMDSMRSTPVFGSLFSKTYSVNTFSYSDTIGNVYKYLDLLEVKASNSSQLREHVTIFKKRLERARVCEKETKNKQFKLIFGLVIAFLGFIGFCLLMSRISN